MATAPVSRKLNLTRDQLAAFLTDQQQIRQFELLFSTVDQLQVITGTDFEFQADNAAALVAAGGAQMIRQQDFTPEQLAEALTGWLTDRKGLAEAAAAASAAGHPEAAQRLANLVIATGLIA